MGSFKDYTKHEALKKILSQIKTGTSQETRGVQQHWTVDLEGVTWFIKSILLLKEEINS